MKAKVTAYKGILVIEAQEPEKPDPDWVPIGPGKIGCVLCNTKKNLGVSEEALALLALVKRSRDAIGDVDWWAADDGTKVFGWLGGFCRILRPTEIEGSRDYTVFREDCIVIPNDVPEEARKAIDQAG
jgi:hypothetical protein